MEYEQFLQLLPPSLQQNVSRETFLKHVQHHQLLLKWQKSIQLVSHSTLKEYWVRHVIDSLQVELLYPKQLQWADIGSGGGFPGLTLAIQNVQTADFQMHLVESNARKCAFLQEVARITGAPTTVHNQRIEGGLSAQFEHLVVSARALAEVHTLLGYAEILVRTAASYECVFLKSESVKDELTQALQWWKFDYDITPSLTDPRGCIVRIGNIRR